MLYVYHHAGHPNDVKTAVLDYSCDAELGGDIYSAKSTGGMWLEIASQDGKRTWPVSWICKKASHTSGSTADSETTSLAGSNDIGLKREVIPILDHLEVSLNRSVKLVGKEDNTQAIAFVKRGYSPALRYLKRHCDLSLGFVNEVFHSDPSDPDAPQYDAELIFWPSSDHKGD